jgi:DNA-binding NarL/FixJ family response regulator
VINVLIADDHPLVRQGIRSLLEANEQIRVVGEAADGAEAIARCAVGGVDVVLMDLSMPHVDGVTATRELTAGQPQTKVLVLSSFADHDRVRQAIAAGAAGYVLKDSQPAELVAAIAAAAAGHAPLDPRVAGALMRDVAAGAGPQLSPRETEVLGLVARGLANKQIARQLGITERTVKVHLGNVFRRIGVTDRTSAALWAREHRPGAPS